PAPAQLDTACVGETLVLGQLLEMERLDAVAGKCQRIKGGEIAGLERRVDLGGTDAQARGIEREPIELPRRLDQRRVAADCDILHDGPARRLDIGRDLALGGEERRETLVEIGAVSVEANGDGSYPAGFEGLLQWRGREWPSTLEPPSFRDGPPGPP